ncbi:esterase/lipase family protein [Mycobacterium sp. NPDC048908]|uniref:esterase/lipase family protein n=1 Tax=Mycobacterium sp. NPDC048908 TaxID=3364292 RepID=UPI0037119B2C
MSDSMHQDGGELPDADAALPPDYRLLAREWRTVGEYVAARRSVRQISAWPVGDGHPVLVLPGFLAGAASTQFLRQALRRLGYRSYDWRLGTNLGIRPGLLKQLPTRLDDIRARNDGRKVTLIGWSAGGIYARELARAQPDDVRMVITLGSPIRGNQQATHAWRMWRLLNRKTQARQVVSDAARIAREEPLPVPTTCIYSKTDGIVAWQCCLSRPAAETENVEVHCSHLGYGHNLETLRVIADRLAQPEGQWRPYVPSVR